MPIRKRIQKEKELGTIIYYGDILALKTIKCPVCDRIHDNWYDVVDGKLVRAIVRLECTSDDLCIWCTKNFLFTQYKSNKGFPLEYRFIRWLTCKIVHERPIWLRT